MESAPRVPQATTGYFEGVISHGHMDRMDRDTYTVPKFLLDRLSWFSMVLTRSSRAPLFNRNSSPVER